MRTDVSWSGSTEVYPESMAMLVGMIKMNYRSLGYIHSFQTDPYEKMGGRKDVGPRLFIQNATLYKSMQESQGCEDNTLLNRGFASNTKFH